jgi:signal transducing adaptor molecule
MSVRPKIVKLIDKYSQKRGALKSTDANVSLNNFVSLADLVSMNETFVKARSIFDRMMEDSLARHTGGKLSNAVLYGVLLILHRL